jgi:hypothetical protein
MPSTCRMSLRTYIVMHKSLREYFCGRRSSSTPCLALVLAAACLVSSCTSSRRLSREELPLPGKYSIVMEAIEGSRKGGSTSGVLYLRRATRQDRSPTTGELVADLGSVPELWGYATIHLGDVGAPVCEDSVPPSSSDPTRPGVVLLGPTAGREYPVLLVSTSQNYRDGIMRTDGCGIGLALESWSRSSASGSWREWGIALNGRGNFKIERDRGLE